MRVPDTSSTLEVERAVEPPSLAKCQARLHSFSLVERHGSRIAIRGRSEGTSVCCSRSLLGSAGSRVGSLEGGSNQSESDVCRIIW